MKQQTQQKALIAEESKADGLHGLNKKLEQIQGTGSEERKEKLEETPRKKLSLDPKKPKKWG